MGNVDLTTDSKLMGSHKMFCDDFINSDPLFNV
jgi:hypothetical protein